MAYEIFEPILASTLRGLPTQELSIGQAVTTLAQRLERAVTVREVADHLKWKKSLVYKHLKSVVKHRLVKYTREKNEKRLLACDHAADGFLPQPRSVLRHNPEIGDKVKYVDPFTGAWKKVSR